MGKYVLLVVCSLTSAVFASVKVTAPSNDATVQSPVHYSATAGSTSCSKGVASMGIYTAPGVLAYVENGTSLSADLTLAPGTYHTTVEQWDYCGGASTTAITITVDGSGGKTFSKVQASGGWTGYGELPPDYNICSSCGSGVTWSMKQKITSPSLSDDATEFTIGGDTPYSDVLWNNHLIGPGSSQGVPDTGETIVPTLHNFTYDVYFYGTNLSLAENLEFDIGQFFDNLSLMFGTQCQIVNGSQWGIWDNAKGSWISTGIPCQPKSNYWNHLTLTFERTSSNDLLYKTVTLNGVTHTFSSTTYGPTSKPGWYGLVLNFQLDGNYKQSPYGVYLDNLSITYQ